MTDPTPASPSIDAKNVPRRYIYNQADMEHFRHSPARKELLSFVSAMGRGLAASSSGSISSNITTNATTTNSAGGYHPLFPLENLTPALASLHGSLSCMSKTWMDPNNGGIPPDFKVKARFGNPEFRTWHARLVERSYGIVRCLMDCHVKYSSAIHATAAAGEEVVNVDGLTKEQILKECSEQGYSVASNEGHAIFLQQHKESSVECVSSSKQEDIIAELRAYLHDSFGHPIRIDYGTGHESSFIVFLLSLCKIGCFRWGGANKKENIDNNNNGGGDDKNKSNPPPEVIGLASLSLFHAYLNVTRGLQRDYMLEPAGSHGVWGLDDYHCVPFYLGACQMMAREQWQKDQRAKKRTNDVKVEPEQGTGTDAEAANRMPDNPYLPETSSHGADQPTPVDTHLDNDIWPPSIIHDRPVLEAQRSTYLYLSCIYFIQQIKPKVPFFESSPMLNDISQIGGGWSKVSSGLLRLYEGEVLDKMPVVQHFVFGKIFSANWSPSRKTPLEAPKKTFINGPMGEECIAPWASGGDVSAQRAPALTSYPGGMPPTRAPWAK